MPDRYHIKVTDEALADLENIHAYIEPHSPDNAAKVIEGILSEIDELSTMPSRYKLVGRSRKTGAPVHSLVVRPHLVYYRVEAQRRAIFILTIRHGRQQQLSRFE